MSAVTTLPPLRIDIDGSRLSPAQVNRITSIHVRQRLSLSTACEVLSSDAIGGTGGPPEIGAHLEISVGDGGPLFAGEITAIEHRCSRSEGRVIRLRAYDPLHRLRKQQRVEAHVQVTAASLARDLAAPLGLDVRGADGPSFARAVQYRQNDLDFLAEICERSALFFFVDGDSLRLFALDDGTGERKLTLGRNLREARVELNAETVCSNVSVIGWDPLLIEMRDARAERDHEVPRELAAMPAAERILADELVENDAQAEALAHADLARRAAGEIGVWGIAEGDPELTPGIVVDIEGVEDGQSRRAVVTAVDHTVSRAHGFISEFSNELPRRRVRDHGATAVVGVVTRVDDPDGRGRVKLSLPAYGYIESEWLPVVTTGAGASKGWISIPDVDDSVVAIFPRGETGIGFVVGGLFRDKPPDAGVEAGRVKRFSFLTPGGQKLQLDDVRNSIRMQNKQGSYVELTPEKLIVHASGDLDLEAPGRTVTIRGNLVNFERG